VAVRGRRTYAAVACSLCAAASGARAASTSAAWHDDDCCLGGLGFECLDCCFGLYCFACCLPAFEEGLRLPFIYPTRNPSATKGPGRKRQWGGLVQGVGLRQTTKFSIDDYPLLATLPARDVRRVNVHKGARSRFRVLAAQVSRTSLEQGAAGSGTWRRCGSGRQ
jgi:hypothetical protein